MKERNNVPLPVVVTKEGGWFVAWTPIWDIASQGKTYEESLKNLKEAINLYLEDPDAKKIKRVQISQISITTVMTPLRKGAIDAKTTSSVGQ